MSVWSASLDCLAHGTVPAGGAALVLTLAGSFGFRAFRVEQDGQRFDPIGEWEHPVLLATAVQWSRQQAHGSADSDAPEEAWLVVPARGASPDGEERELRPTDVWMWSLRGRSLERFLCFGAPVTAIQRVPGPMRRDARVAICLPGEVFVFQGRKLQHRFGVACCPSPVEERSRQRDAAARAAAAGASWGPPDLSVWRPAAALSGRFLAVAAADAAPAQPAESVKHSRSGTTSGMSLRAVARDAAVGLLRLGDTVDSAGRIASAAGWAAVDRARGAAQAALGPAGGGGDAHSAARGPSAGPELRRAAAGMRPPDRWQTLLTALAGAAAEADAAAAAGGGAGSVAVVDLESASVVAHWQALPTGKVLAAVALSAAGTALATSDGTGQLVQLWRVLPPSTGAPPPAAGTAAAPSHRLLAVLDRGIQPSPVRALALTADATLVTCATLRGTLHVWAAGARAVSLRDWAGGAADDAAPSLAFVGGIAGDGKEAPAGYQAAADDEWGGGARPKPEGGTDAVRASPPGEQAGVEVVVADVAASAVGWRAARGRRRGAHGDVGDREAEEAAALGPASDAGSSAASSARSVSPSQPRASAGSEGEAPRRGTARVHTKAALGPSSDVPSLASFARLQLVGAGSLAALVKNGGGEPRLAPQPQTAASVARGDLVAVALGDGAGAGARAVLVVGAGATGGMTAAVLEPVPASAGSGGASRSTTGAGASAGDQSSTSSIAAGLTAMLGRAGPQAADELPAACHVSVADATRLAVELEARADAGDVVRGGCSSRWAQGSDARAREGAATKPGGTAMLPAIPASTAPWYPIPPWQRPNLRLRRPGAGEHRAKGAPACTGISGMPCQAMDLAPSAVFGAPHPAPCLDAGDLGGALQEALGGSLGSPTER